MRRCLTRMLIALLTFALGASLPTSLRKLTSRVTTQTSSLPQAGGAFASSLPAGQLDHNWKGYDICPLKERNVVISIPNDNEIYIGNEKVTLTEIPNKVSFLLKNTPPGTIVYIKAADSVKYRTFVPIIYQIRETYDKGIGLVRSKKRRIK